jgi:beta-glucuronidase
MMRSLQTWANRICFMINAMFLCAMVAMGQTAMTNVSSRHCTSLNGRWQTIIDPTGIGTWRQVWLEKLPEKKTDFFEYSFTGGPLLNVPGDFNTQMPELTFMEGLVWYKQTFDYKAKQGKRYFLHFGAVNYLADVYLNGVLLGSHEGGFTPFQFELTGLTKEGPNAVVVKVNNQRRPDGLPALGYDWMNYGGITRDVNLIETNSTFIEDYCIQLKKGSQKEVLGWVRLNGNAANQLISIKIPELGIDHKTQTNENGVAEVNFAAKFKLWSPSSPKLYNVIVQCQTDTVTDEIGFRTIETKDAQILLNGQPLFLKGVNIHEENPFTGARAFSEADALVLLNWAKELGCNFVRLAHYPHNEYMVKTAEKMGLLVWSELPVYQNIEFANAVVPQKMELMMQEMIRRDRNRCSVFIWSLSNETYSSTPNRDNVLIDMAQKCKQIDSTRLTTAVICTQSYQNHTVDVWDTLYKYYDVISVNEYYGWYTPWQGKPKDTKWKLVCNKPVIISEFGGEAAYGSKGPTDEANYWTEEYQEQIYKDQTEMFATIPNLCGVCPWLLVDYRSLGRMHPVYQNGWNRKGLLSDRGQKKKAWFVMQHYYQNKK